MIALSSPVWRGRSAGGRRPWIPGIGGSKGRACCRGWAGSTPNRLHAPPWEAGASRVIVNQPEPTGDGIQQGIGAPQEVRGVHQGGAQLRAALLSAGRG